MTIFKTTRAYIIAFVLYAVCVLPMIRAGLRREWFLHTPDAHPQFVNIVGALFCVAFFVSLMRKTTSLLEKAALVSTLAVCVLWMLNILAAYGLQWLSFPANFAVSTGIAVIATALVGVRAMQFSRRSH